MNGFKINHPKLWVRMLQQIKMLPFLLAFTTLKSTATTCNEIPKALLKTVQTSQFNMLLVGEIHGSKEAPSRFYDLACNAIKHAPRNVKVGIELLKGQTISNGSAEDLDQSITTSWQWRDHHDGRTSNAIYTLLQRLNVHVMKNEVTVFYFDTDSDERDRSMAELVLKSGDKDDLLLVFSGNRHNKIIHGNSWSASSKNMGAFIKAQGNEVLSVNLLPEGGFSWYCDEQCGIHPLKHLELGHKEELFKASTASGFDYHWRIGHATASLPLVQKQ